ncbi:MAG: hypothetical protein CMA21_02595 [Euryarchaeota archaeon]|nr:hypothetical protein [Euryarchaeota archaeon]|tara:strand:+ start:106 stop:558 length:453 start_codon:yes stop_codon:yes gene_type:complete
MGEPRSNDPVILLDEVFPGDTNALNTLFGGHLMSIMDRAAGLASSKFAHEEFVTVSVDALKFERPAYQGDIIRTIGRVVWTSPRTVGVLVRSCRMTRSDWEPEQICSGYFFMVAIDDEMRPISVPQFTPKSDEEISLWNDANAARDAMRR